MRGLVGNADRVQRLVIGLLLMLLNLSGLLTSPDLYKWIALAVQMELIVTGAVGWCPLYWGLGHSSKSEPD